MRRPNSKYNDHEQIRTRSQRFLSFSHRFSSQTEFGKQTLSNKFSDFLNHKIILV